MMSMKRIISVVFLLLLLGCTKLYDNNITDFSESYCYEAFWEDVVSVDKTRTYLDENLKLLWHSQDEISIFTSTLNQKYQFAGKTGDNSGSFSLVPSGNFGGANEIKRNYAVYPYDDNNKIESDESYITVPLPHIQNYAKSSVGKKANISVAVTTGITDNLLKFKNACSYIQIRLYGDGYSVKSIEFKGNGGEMLAGTARIAASNTDVPKLSVINDADAVESILLDCGNEGVELEASKENYTDFWIVLPPTIFTQGLKLFITDVNGNRMTRNYSSKFEFKRSEYMWDIFEFKPTENITKQIEKEALIALYNSLGGEQWTNKENWCSEEPVGNWEGVTMDESGFVVGIDLASNNLQGAMPDAIGDFSKLTTLDLSGNSISGTLPDGICRLTSLENLNLADNSLSGSIPNDIGNLSEVVMLDLSGNSLSGSVPESLWTGIAGLQKLFLNDNQLAGGLTASMGQATSLLELDLSGNSFNSVLPAQICSLVNLKVLDMNSAAVYGTIPASIGGMVSLVTLDLGNNGLSGTIPSSVTQLASLETLNLATNGLRGEIPQEIGSLANLKNLHLNNNMLEGSLPEGITGCTELDYLYLAYNAQLGGIIPVSVFENLIGYSIEGTGVSIEQSATLPDLEPGEGDINWN